MTEAVSAPPQPGGEALVRLPDWEPRLASWLASCARKPHRYGSHDCMLFCAGVVRALTGYDFGRGHRGQYRGRQSAAAYLEKLGFDRPAAMIDSLFAQVPLTFAGRGDLVADAEGVPGVCLGSDALFVGPTGLVRAPRRSWTRAWRI